MPLIFVIYKSVHFFLIKGNTKKQKLKIWSTHLPMTGVASFPLKMNTGKNIEKTQPLEKESIFSYFNY